MWIALLLPFLVLPALVGFSRFEERVMRASASPRAVRRTDRAGMGGA
jgi:hypothetical protein